MYLIISVLVIVIGLMIGYRMMVKQIMSPSKNYPKISAIVPNKKILVCAGDSITHGNMSYDWVKDLNTELADYQVFNAGVSADLSYTLLNRLDDIIAVKPNHINILIGTNDIVAQTRPLKKSDNYIKFKKIEWGTQPSIESYEANLRQIIIRLQKETTASISLMSIAMIGEDLRHPIAKTVANYNQIVQKIARETGVAYLPVFEDQLFYLKTNQAQSAILFENTDDYVVRSAYLHILFGWSWDQITEQHKHLLTFDNLHFNSVGAGFIKDLLVNHLKAEKSFKKS
jgi:lysophospholipase L1-like esterase